MKGAVRGGEKDTTPLSVLSGTAGQRRNYFEF